MKVLCLSLAEGIKDMAEDHLMNLHFLVTPLKKNWQGHVSKLH